MMNLLQSAKEIFSDNKKFIISMFLFGLAIRLIFVFFLENKFYFSDSLLYEDGAMSILEGKGFGDYKRAPLYPIWMATIYFFTGGKSIIAVRILESLLGALIPVIIFSFGRKMFSRRVGAIAAAISVIYPIFIFVTGLVYPTLIGTFLVTVGTYLVFLIKEGGAKGYSLLSGISFGLAALAVAPIATLILAVLAWVFFFTGLDFKKRIINCSIIAASFAVTLTPWIVRNYIYYNKFVPIRHGAQRNILNYHIKKNRPKTQESPQKTNGAEPRPSLLKLSLDIVADNTNGFLYFWRLSPAQDRLKSANPDYNLKIYDKDRRITKENKFSASDLSFIVPGIAFTPVLIFAIISIFTMRGQLRNGLLLIMLILTLAITYSFFHAKVRYRIPIEPLLIVLAACGINNAIEFVKSKLS